MHQLQQLETVATERLMPLFKSNSMPIDPYRVAYEINEFLNDETVHIGDDGDAEAI